MSSATIITMLGRVLTGCSLIWVVPVSTASAITPPEITRSK